MNWELMRPQDIEIRPAMTKNGKTTLLLFQDSRNTMNALDRNFGTFGWSITYKDVGGQIYGSLSIKNPETGEWISKEDTGDESNISAQKGQSSDILKRCAVRFGYGRELYSAPRIIVDDDGYGNAGYKVLEINYDSNRNIKHLVIGNKWGKEVWRWDNDKPTQTQTVAYTLRVKPVEEPKAYDVNEEPPVSVDNSIAAQIKAYCGKKKLEQGVDLKELKAFFKFYSDRADKWKYKKFNGDSLWDSWMARVAS